MNLKTSQEIRQALLSPVQWVDVRAPVEFQLGAVPGAVNLPLLTDDERHLIGLCYKNKGQQAAIELGHQLVGGVVRQDRTDQWIQACQQKSTFIYCFRGGLRSQTVQAWLKEKGLEVPIVVGGYKALRQELLNILVEKSAELQLSIVAGPTGSGKTTYIRSQRGPNGTKPFIDLEDLAKHRGSAFGAMFVPQPSQGHFENLLALELLKLGHPAESVLVEAESRMIGKCAVPAVFFEKMKASPRLHLQVPLEDRVQNIYQDYVLDSPLLQAGNPRQFDLFETAVQSIQKKLGGLRAQEILQDLAIARAEFSVDRATASNKVWIRKLLQWYYDPLYQKIKTPSVD